MILLLGLTAYHPYADRGAELIENQREAITQQARGPHSRKLPLIPFYVSIQRAEGPQVFYAIHCFPFGTVGMAYVKEDGFHIEKPLTRL